jgi:hypothetical protein
VRVRHFAALVVIVIVICHAEEHYDPRNDKENNESRGVGPKEQNDYRQHYYHRYDKASRQP